MEHSRSTLCKRIACSIFTCWNIPSWTPAATLWGSPIKHEKDPNGGEQRSPAKSPHWAPSWPWAPTASHVCEAAEFLLTIPTPQPAPVRHLNAWSIHSIVRNNEPFCSTSLHFRVVLCRRAPKFPQCPESKYRGVVRGQQIGYIPLHHTWPYRASESGTGSQAWESEKQNFCFTWSLLLFQESLEQNSFISQWQAAQATLAWDLSLVIVAV